MNTAETYKKRIDRIFRNLKNERKDVDASPLIPVFDVDKFSAYLRVASKSVLNNGDDLKNMAKWRKKHNWWFPAQFTVTQEGTRTWFENQVLSAPDRLLFMIDMPNGVTIGHAGFYRFDYDNRSCEIDNILRGIDLAPGVMTHVVKELSGWAFDVLKVRSLFLTVFEDNEKAIKLYTKVGFKKIGRIPLKRVVEKQITRWEEINNDTEAKRYYLKMVISQGSA